VAAIAPQIESTELFRASRRRPENLSAYEIALRAWAHALEGLDKGDRTLLDSSIREAEEALAIDPNSVLALHALGRAYGTILYLQMAADKEHAVRKSTWAAGRAIELDSADPLGYALRGLCVQLGGKVDRYPDALADSRRAHEMNPNDTFVLRLLGYVEAGIGEPELAIERGHQILRLSPRQSRSHEVYHMMAYASFGAKRYADGVRWASRALNDMPGMIQPHITLVGCLVGMGEIDKGLELRSRRAKGWHRTISGSGWRVHRHTRGRRIVSGNTPSSASPLDWKTRGPRTRCDEPGAALLAAIASVDEVIE
jgi:adenylate cyclase